MQRGAHKTCPSMLVHFVVDEIDPAAAPIIVVVALLADVFVVVALLVDVFDIVVVVVVAFAEEGVVVAASRHSMLTLKLRVAFAAAWRVALQPLALLGQPICWLQF